MKTITSSRREAVAQQIERVGIVAVIRLERSGQAARGRRRARRRRRACARSDDDRAGGGGSDPGTGADAAARGSCSVPEP